MQYLFESPIDGVIRTTRHAYTISWKNGSFGANTSGNSGTPDAITLLLSSLAASVLDVMQAHIIESQWNIPEIHVECNLYEESKDEQVTSVCDCDIIFPNSVPDEQRVKLKEIALQSPVSNILSGNVKLRAFLRRDADTKTIVYDNEKVEVLWKPELCQHSTRCWQQLPEVFNPTIKKWIDVNGASPEDIAAQVHNCPSGALLFRRK